MKDRFFKNNKNKSCNATPVVLTVPMILSLGGAVAATVAGGPIGVGAAVVGLMVGGTSAGTLTAWGVSRVTGKISLFREKLDNAVDYAWMKRFSAKWSQVVSYVPRRGEAFEMLEMPRPVQIICAKQGQSLEVDDEALGRILLADTVKDKPVVVISLAGAAGTGKSFLLDFFLQYMRSGCQNDWMGHPSVSLGGDPWREACEPDTTGILLCEEVFLVTRSDGQQLAVLFMYTHGACDAISTVGDSARLFALSTMTSSVQVYNLSETITEEDIKHLQFLTDYEILMQQDRSDVPLQELLFLVRDWSEQQNAEYGAEGGRGFLHTRLRILDGQNKELQQLRRFITSCFTTIRCFLMPHPGSKVANTSSFDGPLSDIEGNFKEQLHELVSSLLGPDKLSVKRINGKEITCQELMAYFQLCGGDQPYLSPAVLESHHQRQRELAKKWICDRLKMPGEEASQRCLDELTQEIDLAFHKFAMLNKTKMTAVMIRTPTTLFVTVLVFYFMSGTFALIGADSFANFCNLVMGLSSIGLLLWSYVRMSGAMPEVGALIDNIATILWESVTRPKGDQVAVLFMDTQGAFDSDTTLEDCATIFALSTLTSSVQVYNLSKNIHENDLQHLQFFTEYGRMAQQHKSREKPFQKLLFLVRDWAHIADAEYGGKGGRKILKRRLNTSWRKKEQKRLRDLIHTCFNEIDCFLLPYPGHQKYASIFKEKKLPEIKSFIELRRLFHITPAEDVSSNPQHDSHSLRDYRDATVEQVETAQPVQILRIMDHQRVELDEEELGRILLADHVKDKPVVVVSVAGAFRKGKSFLLDFFLRYVGSGCQDDWLDDPSIPLGGISWREVCERGTPSILIWDEVFLVKTSQGRQLAVLFMYTQGAFDGASTFKDCAKVLALSTMTSSVLVYNLSRNINDNDLQHLQPLNEYARLVQQVCTEIGGRIGVVYKGFKSPDTGKEPFQNLQLLVRDWTNQPEAGYGAEGGWTILNRWLQSSGGQHKYLQQLRRHIWSCFEKIGCFLMPHPGYQVATTASFDGPFSDVHEDFKTQLRELVPSLLAPDNLLVKKINGREITCQELMTYFQVYVNIFKNYELPNPMTMLEAMAEATNVAAVATAKDEYISHMEQLCGEDQPYLCPELLERHHLRLRESAKKLFALRKMPGEQSSQQYMERLTKEIHETYKSFAERNERKKIVAALRTPATLFIVVLAFYLSSCTLCLLGLHSHANISNVLMALSLISLSLWGYVRFTGRMWEVGAHIDTIAAILWAIVSGGGFSFHFLFSDTIYAVFRHNEAPFGIAKLGRLTEACMPNKQWTNEKLKVCTFSSPIRRLGILIFKLWFNRECFELGNFCSRRLRENKLALTSL
ncbi:hypothetical protein HPB48_023325 [Haemaphysalis longicornis]|uniref:GB1/RHD3-type G domain-containing protein n=1 Tax=Haemaphysalis longicornis TaxID=44386 RepID=A0A9J6H4Y4_HAELO|nr:hypothetical protein HPB48_023325 [Haemaphysalis longicornis]